MRAFWQSKPSILFGDWVCPSLALEHLPLKLDDGEDEAEVNVLGDDEKRGCFSFVKWASRINGFIALQGGEPEKKGGDDDKSDVYCVAAMPSC